MRALLNIITDLLTESVGLANRKSGEKFANPAGDILTFQSLNFYPESGRFDGSKLQQAQTDLGKQGIDAEKIVWTNRATSAAGAFGIVTFTTDTGEPFYVGRWFGNIRPNRASNNWPNSELPGNFKLQTGAAKKEDSNMQPSKILTQFTDNTPDTISEQVVARFGADSDQARAIQAFMSSNLPAKVPAGNMLQSAFQDYFCELLGPIALVQGKKVSGNAIEAANIFFGPKQGYADCTISFNANSVGSLYDSLLINGQGRQIKLSSKGKEGATASVVNLVKSIDELQLAPKGQKLIKTYKDAIDITRTIQRKGQTQAPLSLAVQFGIINEKEAQQILALKDADPKEDIINSNRLTARLKKMYSARKSRRESRMVPFYHLLASVAFNVADHINKNTNFPEAASSILNHAALVQLYTTVTKDGSDFVIKMEASYPGEAITGVYIDASKVYYSSGNKGNFTFKILKNGANLDDVNPADPVDDGDVTPAQPDVEELDKITDQPRLTGPGARAARTTAKPDNSITALGREKRRR